MKKGCRGAKQRRHYQSASAQSHRLGIHLPYYALYVEVAVLGISIRATTR